MKKLLKRPQLWIAVGFLIIAGAIAVTGQILHSGAELVSKYNKACQSGDVSTMASCYIYSETNEKVSEEDIAELAEALQSTKDYYSEYYDGYGEVTFSIQYGDVISDDGEDKTITANMIVKKGGIVIDIISKTLPVRTVNGTDYFVFE